MQDKGKTADQVITANCNLTDSKVSECECVCGGGTAICLIIFIKVPCLLIYFLFNCLYKLYD